MDFKFEYFLNAIHYNIYLEEVWTNKKVNKLVNGLFAVIFRIPFIRKYRKKYDGQKAKELDDFYYGNKAGLSISVAHYCFGYFYSGYSILFSFLLGGFALRELGNLSNVTKLAILAIPIGLCYIPAYRAVFAKDRYQKYFRQFKKEDKHWHRKWKRITFAFCIGSIVTTILGICAAFAIAIV